MEKEFVPYEQALALKELGFDEPCFGYYESTYGKEKVIIEPSKLITNSNYSKVFSEIRYRIVTPTFSQAFRWFRDNFGLSGWVDESFTTNNRQGVVSVKSPKGLEYIQSPKATMFFETYEEAELACLKKLIEIIKNK